MRSNIISIILIIVLLCFSGAGCFQKNTQSSAQTLDERMPKNNQDVQPSEMPNINQTGKKSEDVDFTELNELATDLLPNGKRSPAPDNLIKQMLSENKELKQCFKEEYKNNFSEFKRGIEAETPDLNGDGTKDFIVNVENLCGAHNSPTFVYQLVGSRYRLLFYTISEGIQLKTTKTNGFNDLYVHYRGGELIGEVAICKFTKSKYQPTKCFEFRPYDFKANNLKIQVKPHNCNEPT